MIAFAEEFSFVNAESTTPKTEKHLLILPSVDSAEAKIKTEPAPPTFTVSASVYYPEPNQTDATPYTTADGSRINKHDPGKQRWIAVSRDLHSRWGGEINYGDSLLVTGISEEMDGLYIVRDVMNRRIHNRVDILVGRKDRIMGFWDEVQVAKL
ncbi:hypothetical protein I2I11_13210 [Pontibacter sp. 172403-2]|uniref:hypothetical protein n=1 Tax=Pontibacter rufus TaxID=2791028 RepID=UPI0018AF6EA9|nr:hypothetical protein [Pontibacter sp. 172403-2]MBF9254257.1 hypothetical protein [Pontibacter sp. 172403-2]